MSQAPPPPEPTPAPASRYTLAGARRALEQAFEIVAAGDQAPQRGGGPAGIGRKAGQDPLRGPRAAIVGLLGFIGLGVVSALVWSLVVEIDVSATGNGRLVPSRHVQLVQNLEGGIVKAIMTREGALVEAGQTVLRIEDTEFNATYQEGREAHAGLEAQVARLTAEAGHREPAFPAWLRREQPAMVAKERSLWLSRKDGLAATVGSLKEEVARARTTRARASENLPLLRQTLHLARKQRAILAPQVARGLISQVELLSTDQRVLDLTTRINDAASEIPSADALIRQNEGRIRAEEQKARAETLAQLQDALVKLAGMRAQLAAHKDRVTRRDVLAPVKGVVKKLAVSTVGQVVRPGDSLAEIVPADDKLIAEARFSPKDIAFIHEGQTAFIRVTAYDSSIYGAQPARVIHVSADATVNEREEVYYIVRVEATQALKQAEEQLPLLPGMVAQVDVVTGKRTIFDYVAKPITKIRYTAMHER